MSVETCDIFKLEWKSTQAYSLCLEDVLKHKASNKFDNNKKMEYLRIKYGF